MGSGVSGFCPVRRILQVIQLHKTTKTDLSVPSEQKNLSLFSRAVCGWLKFFLNDILHKELEAFGPPEQAQRNTREPGS